MTIESIVAIGTGLLALIHSIWTARKLPPKPQLPVTKEELYGKQPPKP